MAIFTGELCPYCDKNFTAADDVVVCPICGAPYHRSCYQENNHCLFQQQHNEGYVWKSTLSPHRPAAETSCPVCGGANHSGGSFCQHCGNPLEHAPYSPGQSESPWSREIPPQDERAQSDHSPFGGSAGQTAGENAYRPSTPFPGFNPATAYMAAMGGVSPEMDFDGVSAQELAIYVGERSHYFLPRFAAIHNDRRFITFNLPAFLLGAPYFFYRKMYREGLIILALFAVLFIPIFALIPQNAAFLAENFTQLMSGADLTAQLLEATPPWVSVIGPIIRVLFMLLLFFCAFAANHFYYQSCLRNIRALRENCAKNADDQGASIDDLHFTTLLAHRGRTSINAAVLVALGAVAAYFVISYLLVLPYVPQMMEAMGG